MKLVCQENEKLQPLIQILIFTIVFGKVAKVPTIWYLTRDIPIDQAITHADVELPPCRLCDILWAEQNTYFVQSNSV